MSDEKRTNEVMVRLSDSELARLDELRRGVTPRAVYLRNLLRESPADRDVADHREALALLSEQARAGKVAAAVALERALRHEDHGDFDNDLARILAG